MKRSIYIAFALSLSFCHLSTGVAQRAKLMSLTEIVKTMTNSSTTYVVSEGSPDSLRAVAMKNLFPLAEAYTPNPVVTGPENDRHVSRNEFPGLTMEMSEQAEKAFSARDIPAARAAYSNILKSSPGCYLAMANLGDCFMMEGNGDSAIAYYDRAIKMAPFDYIDYIYKADVQYSMGRYDDARNTLVEVLALRPRYHTVSTMLDRMPKLGIARHDSLFAPASYAFLKGNEVHLEFSLQKENAPWMWYAMAKAVWLGEPAHRKEISGTENYSWCSSHELESLSALLDGYESSKDTVGRIPQLETLESVVHDGLGQAFVLYEVASRMDENIMLKVTDEEREQVRAYIRKYILPRT